MSDERWRCFVAVPLGDTLRSGVAAAVDGWRRRADLAGLRWTGPESWHVTLAYLGSIDASLVTGLAARLADAVDHHAAVRLPTGGVGAFPSAARGRVAWYGVTDVDGAFAALAADVRRAAGVESAAFRGHVTLARAKHRPVDVRAWVRDAGAPVGELAVDRVELMRSHLSRGPARYEVLESLPLRVATRV